MLDRGIVRKVLSEALARGGDLAELDVEERASTVLRLDDSRVENVSSGRDRGAGVRVLAGQRASYAYTNVLEEPALLDAARAARAGLDGPEGSVSSDLRRVTGPTTHPVRVSPDGVGAEKKAAALLSADEAARRVGDSVRQVSANFLDVHQKVLVATSEGLWAEDDRTRVRIHYDDPAAGGLITLAS